MRVIRRVFAVAVLLLAGFTANLACAAGWQSVGEVKQVVRLPDGVELVSEVARVRVTAFRDGIMRVRLAPNGTFAKDSSWAVVEGARPPAFQLEDTRERVRLVTPLVTAEIRKSPLLISFLDASGRVLSADAPRQPMAWERSSVRVWKTMPAEEFYYGLGEKAGPMNRRDRAFSMWNTDAYGWQESTDPLYKAPTAFRQPPH